MSKDKYYKELEEFFIQSAWKLVQEMFKDCPKNNCLFFCLSHYLRDMGKEISPYFYTYPTEIEVYRKNDFKKFKKDCLTIMRRIKFGLEV